MYVSNLDSIYPPGETGLSVEKNDVLGRDQFLRLLVTQLQHQDPLNPLDGTDFSAQLAQFSSLEQLFNMNDSLSKVVQSLDAQKTSNVLDYIGKKVMCSDNHTISVIGGKPIAGTYRMEDQAEVMIRIYDNTGFERCSYYAGWKDPGEYPIDWDGTDNDGDSVSDGEYTYTIEARDQRGYTVPVETCLAGEVTGVTYKNGIPFLMMGDKPVSIDSIVEVQKIAATE